MSALKQATLAYGAEPTNFVNIVAPGTSTDSWVLNLPPRLRTYQGEIELLLGRVFAGRPRSADNLELAQQMTLNWCISKCRKVGLPWDDSYVYDN